MTRILSLLLLFSSLVFGSACKNSGDPKTQMTASSLSLPADQLNALVKGVPNEAQLVASVLSPIDLEAMLTRFGVPMEQSIRDEMNQSLEAHFKKHVLPDLRHVKAVVFYATSLNPPTGALLFAGADTTHFDPAAFDSAPFAAAAVNETLVIGDPQSVATSQSRLEGKKDISADSFINDFRKDASNSFFTFFGKTQLLSNMGMPEEAEGIDTFRFSADGLHATLKLSGEKSGLERAEALLRKGLDSLVEQSAKAKAQTSSSAFEGMMAIIGYAHLKSFAKTTSIEQEDQILKVEIPLPLANSATPSLLIPSLLGIGAAIAIPSFTKFQSKSKTAEAKALVEQMYGGALEHWIGVNDGDVTSMESGASRFPTPSAGPTPPKGSCCLQPDGLCQPDPSLWDKEPWRSLHFSVDAPHRYSYAYEVSVGKDGAIDGTHNFTARAIGDLDCDGIFSTFEMYGVINEQNADGHEGGAALARINELE